MMYRSECISNKHKNIGLQTCADKRAEILWHLLSCSDKHVQKFYGINFENMCYPIIMKISPKFFLFYFVKYLYCV